MAGALVDFDVEALDYLCAIRGLNRAQLARISGVRQATLSDIVHGKVRPTGLTIQRLALGLARTPVLPEARAMLRQGTVGEKNAAAEEASSAAVADAQGVAVDERPTT